MKVLNGKKFMLASIILLALVRILQYFTVIGGDGFFWSRNFLDTVIIYALYVCIALVLIGSLPIRFGKKKRIPTPAGVFCKPTAALTCLIVAVSLAVEGLVRVFFAANWTGIFSIPAAVYFLLLWARCRGQKMRALNPMAIFALAYPCIRLIYLFYQSFREIKASENMLEVLSLCAMTFLMIALTKLVMGFHESKARIAWCALMYAAFGVFGGVVKLFGFISGSVEFTVAAFVTAISDIMIWRLAIELYCRVSAYQPAEIKTEENEQ